MKRLTVGSLIFLMSLTADAAPGRTPRELLVDYTKQVREAIYGKGKSAKTTNQDRAKDRIVEQLEIPSARVKEIRMSLSGEQSVMAMDALVTTIAAKKLSQEISKVDAQEGTSLAQSADANAKLIASLYLLAPAKTPKKHTELTDAQATLVREAILKSGEISPRMLTEFARLERDSYTKVLEKFDQLNQEVSTRTIEDNFILAIKEVQRVDTTKALEIVKKLKECV